MVKLMLDRLGSDHRRQPRETLHTPDEIECYHVNAQFSEDMGDIGVIRFGKILHVLQYCVEAIWCRFRYGLEYFYYVPAPGKRAALYRDWIVMLMCRPFFKGFVYHWHAVGMGDWLHCEGNWFERWVTHRLLGHSALSLALAVPGMRDALWFESKRVEIVPNGIPDPCPDFERTVLPLRLARTVARKKILAGESLTPGDRERAGGDPEVFKVLYMAHCTRDKGIFDTLESVAIVNTGLLASGSGLRIELSVGGAFMAENEKAEFNERITRDDLRSGIGEKSVVDYKGFISGEEKDRLLRESDCFCFPTYYSAEGQPVNLIESMAFGLPVITTHWRAIPEQLPSEYPGFVPSRAPREIASVLQFFFTHNQAMELREQFTSHFTDQRHIEIMRKALLGMVR